MIAQRAIPVVVVLATCIGANAPASAQTYPSRPITIIAPFEAQVRAGNSSLFREPI
jgi:tripartite-type tricarboxylate transporter receptor subunit TctC